MITDYPGMILPKIWLQRIPEIWDRTVPKNHPKTTSEFSLKFEPRVRELVKEMEVLMGTDSSIVTKEMVPENTLVGAYLGTYDVKGEPGVLTLISPEKVADNAIGVVAIHLNTETNTWEKVEDAQIIDGYVYGTLESFSPIAVFGLKRDTLFVESHEDFKNIPVYAANGIPVVVSANESGEIVAKDANGKEVVLPENTVIFGGTIDGSVVESTNLVVKGLTETYKVYAGSISFDKVIKLKNATLIAKDCSCRLRGSGVNVRCEELNVTIDKCNLPVASLGVGFGQSIDGYKSVPDNIGEGNELGLGENSWLKKANVKITNSNILYLYIGSNNGKYYTEEISTIVENCEIGYLIMGGSNGRTKLSSVSVINSKLENFQTTNRGIVNEAIAKFKNTSVEKLYVYGDSSDNTVNGKVESVAIDITGGSVNIYPGIQSGVTVTKETPNVVKYIKIGETTKVEFFKGSKTIFANHIRYK